MKLIIPEVLQTGHCSNHEYPMTGCVDCDMAVFLEHLEEVSNTEEFFENIEKSFKKVRFKQAVHHLQIDHGTPSPKIQMVRQQLQFKLEKFLQKAAHAAAVAAEEKAKGVVKVDEDDILEVLQATNAAIDWEEIVDDVTDDLSEAGMLGGMDGITQLDIQANLVPDMTTKVEDAAQQYAKRRAAELVGKKFVDGELIGDSDAEWAIADTTRDDLKDLIELAFQEGMSPSDLAMSIRDASTFGPERAELIAKTEVAIAQVQGNLGVWKRTGFVKTVNILLSEDHDLTDECDDIANGGPYGIEDVPFIPLHPRCKCIIIAEEISE